MKRNFFKEADGYRETIRAGIETVQGFRAGMTRGTLSRGEAVSRLREALSKADGIVIGAGAGLSASAGFTYSGERFERCFPDFIRAYGIRDMYAGGFYPYPSKEIFWAYWARYIYINRYTDPPKSVYRDLLSLVKNRDYFVITTNVDHCFQKAGFDKKRLFYTQGDYGLFQSTDPSDRSTYDNEKWVMEAMAAQGFEKNADGVFEIPENGGVSMLLPPELIPKSPQGTALTMNLRSDDSFVEDDGWRRASAAYSDFLRRHKGTRMLFLEVGVGMNTPVIIKYPFWAMTSEDPKALYACLNSGEAYCPIRIEKQSVCIDGDTGEVLKELLDIVYHDSDGR